jgi:hypothetical protein
MKLLYISGEVMANQKTGINSRIYKTQLEKL